jgi:outer membrane protein
MTAFLLLVSSGAAAASAADVEAGIHHVGTIMTGDAAFAGGELDVRTSRGFAASAEVFWTERISTQFAGTFINPVAILNPGDIDLNTVSLDIYSASARYHFTPAARFSPFVGAGAALVSFGNLEERFADDILLELDPRAALLAEAGLRYRFRSRIFLDLTVSYMPLEAETEVIRNNRPGVVLPDRVSFDPLTVSAGAAWRF